MAEVVREADVADRIEHALGFLTREWEDLPEVAAAWDTWDEDERLSFVMNWGVRSDRLAQLEGWAAQDRLTPAPRARYDALLTLVERHRDVLAALLKDEPAAGASG